MLTQRVERTAYIVAGDSKTRKQLDARLKSLEIATCVCPSADEFFKTYTPASAGCVLLDITQPHADLEFLAQLGKPGNYLPVIGLSKCADIRTAVRAMKLGALDFLESNCSDEELAHAIAQAFRWDADNRRHIARVAEFQSRRDKLPPGLRKVFELLVGGRSNSEIAAGLNVSLRCVEDRKAKLKTKMRAESLADLIRQSLIADGMRLARRPDHRVDHRVDPQAEAEQESAPARRAGPARTEHRVAKRRVRSI